jgi:hypothetical protein
MMRERKGRGGLFFFFFFFKDEERGSDLVVKGEDFLEFHGPLGDDVDRAVRALDEKVEEVGGGCDHEATTVMLHCESPVQEDDSIVICQKVLG